MPAHIRKDAGPGPFYRSGPELMEALGRNQYRTEPDLAHLRTNDYKIISSVLELARCRPRSEKTDPRRYWPVVPKDTGPGPFYRSGPQLMEALGRIWAISFLL